MQQWSLDFLSFLCGLIINWWWGFNHLCALVNLRSCKMFGCQLSMAPLRTLSDAQVLHPNVPRKGFWCTTHLQKKTYFQSSATFGRRDLFTLYMVLKIFISSAIVKCLLLMWHWAMSCDKFPVSVKVTSATLVQGKSRLAHSHRRAILIVRCLFKWPAASFALLRFSISL